jgi:hypothetical protein
MGGTSAGSSFFFSKLAERPHPQHRRVDADETYLLGINRQASPIERLQTKHREFQKRMMLAIPLDATPTREPPAGTATKRKVLGETTVTKSGTRSTSTSITPASSRTQEDVFGSGSDAPPRSKPNARLQIFVDPFVGSSGEGSQSQAAEDAAPTPWSELGTRKERTKENIPKVAKVNGATLRQPGGRQQRIASAPAASSSSRIAVFRDPASGEGTMPPPPVRETVPKTPARASVVEEPATPRFVPFKDKVVSVCALQHGWPRSQQDIQPSTPSTSCGTQGGQVPDSVMKVKAATTGQLASSEAEALRKDPFKNYPDKPSETE